MYMHAQYSLNQWVAAALCCLLGASAGLAAAKNTDLPRRAYFGTQLDAAPEGAAGAKVARVVQGGTAQALGIQPGDVVQDINGTTIKSPSDLSAWIGQQASGTAITVRLLRGSEQKVLQGSLVERARELSNASYSVAYGQVASARGALRTISTAPTAAGNIPHCSLSKGSH
jgi:C-terminal processing protease CtpA/Prc